MRVFVRNNTNKVIKELKPGIGEFIISPNEELEIKDFISSMETPTKKEVWYVRYTAKQIATSIVTDFTGTGLEVIEREA